ncbi:hypothetical protein B7P43_G12329 [Cryptotermes secundus]|uniref:TNFR-Cys domain-containing protein n=1 Tax=Cryptotermes secundus TaxID=105785 RepID=A0A2J7QYL7_9NEOP|nr:hypothetical protein B7P43_G12329 [Cryptotermes secundus]
MDMLLKWIGVWLLILWHKENLWVCCGDDPQSYSLPAGNDRNPKPVSTELSALFSSGNDTDNVKKETDEVKLKGDFSVNSTVVTKPNRSGEYTVSMEGGGGVTLHHDFSNLDAGLTPITELPGSLSTYHGSFFVIDHDNTTTSTVARKGVMYKPKIVPRKGVNLNIEGTSTIIEGTDETVEKDNNFLDKTCICCLNNTLKLGIRNGSDDDCSKCCDTMQDDKNTSDKVSSKSETVEPVNLLSADSAGNPTAEDSTPQNTSVSVKHNKHNSGSLNNTATSGTPLSRNKKPLFTLDAANDLPENLNLSSQSLAHDKELNRTDYVIPVVVVIFTVPLFVVLAVFLYKKSLELWERRHYRQMDFLIDGIYND